MRATQQKQGGSPADNAAMAELLGHQSSVLRLLRTGMPSEANVGTTVTVSFPPQRTVSPKPAKA